MKPTLRSPVPEIRFGITIRSGENELGRLVSLASIGLRVHVLQRVDDDLLSLVETCAEMRAFGIQPVPRILVRQLHDEDELHYLTLRLANLAGVKEVLLSEEPIAGRQGTFTSSLELVCMNIIQRYGIERIGIEASEDVFAQLRNLSWFLSNARNRRRITRRKIYFVTRPSAQLEEATLLANSLWIAGHRFPVLASIVVDAPSNIFRLKNPLRGEVVTIQRTPREVTTDIAHLIAGKKGPRLDGVCLYALGEPAEISESILRLALPSRADPARESLG